MRAVFLSAAALSLVLAACSQPAQKAPEAAKAEPRALAGVDLDQPVHVLGTEPFWAVEITPHRHMRSRRTVSSVFFWTSAVGAVTWTSIARRRSRQARSPKRRKRPARHANHSTFQSICCQSGW